MQIYIFELQKKYSLWCILKLYTDIAIKDLHKDDIFYVIETL